MSKILIVDNYDSFTYNLVQQIRQLIRQEPEIVRNDKVQLEKIAEYSHVIFSPGPGLPSEAGLMPTALKLASTKTRVLGVCLGHQCLGETFGATLRNLTSPLHGRATPIKVLKNSCPIFTGLPDTLIVGRYHSWVVDKKTLPFELECVAEDEAGECMALQHREHPLFGVQYHPESVLTPNGDAMMKNFLDLR